MKVALVTLGVVLVRRANCSGLSLRVVTQPMQGEKTHPPELSGHRVRFAIKSVSLARETLGEGCLGYTRPY